jgi:hypothetical protein
METYTSVTVRFGQKGTSASMNHGAGWPRFGRLDQLIDALLKFPESC